MKRKIQLQANTYPRMVYLFILFLYLFISCNSNREIDNNSCVKFEYVGISDHVISTLLIYSNSNSFCEINIDNPIDALQNKRLILNKAEMNITIDFIDAYKSQVVPESKRHTGFKVSLFIDGDIKKEFYLDTYYDFDNFFQELIIELDEAKYKQDLLELKSNITKYDFFSEYN